MRLFVCDPVCVQSFGHNVVALNYFSNAFKHIFDCVVPLCCKYLQKSVVNKYGFDPFYESYYHAFITIPIETVDVEDSLHGFPDALEAQATADARRLLRQYEISASDSMFFPSLDFYGVVGLLNALSEMDAACRPRLFLRFIGVMENASHTYRDPEKELLARIGIARYNGTPISFAAETPRLADRLAAILQVPVAVTPYPTIADVHPISEAGPTVCFCPGSARLDKGFLALRDLFAAVRSEDPNCNIRFVTQSLPNREAYHYQNYVSQLYAMPGVELLPSIISEEEMVSNYRRSTLILLPYDMETYAYRGSAAMMEAICFARPVISLKGSAFAEQIQYYNLGKICSSIEEMAESVLAYTQEKRASIFRKIIQGRYRFTTDVDGAYDRWFKAVA